MTDADAAPGGVGVVVVAAGSGSRLGAEVPKAFVQLRGRTLLSYAVERARGTRGLVAVVLVVPEDYADPSRLTDLGVPLGPDTVIVVGGAERTDSVRAGLAALAVDPRIEVVLVHDAARCLTPPTVFDRVVAAVAAGADGAVPGLAVIDTIKVVDSVGGVTGTLQRASLRAVQTPQGFRAEVLRTAYASGHQATDDAALVERAGGNVIVVDGDPMAFKVTTADDLARAERILAAEWRP